jgi:hypothetical protein
MNTYHVYLAIPGKHFCWGTTTGVINSTARHIVHPFNGGIGFSGAEDFNLCWLDAINLYENGKVSHFAMLHGDTSPDPEQYWLDILLDEMDNRQAVLVSAHNRLKDESGTTSSGVGDPANPWRGAYRRFTVRELLRDLPPTFNNVMAGYPDRPLLHNTGCWVADLRHPIWHETNEDGSLKTIFRFPERAIRGSDGAWVHQRESEDWLLSRELWERGCRSNTWITSRVRLTHYEGSRGYPNWHDPGSNLDGDEATASRWRLERDAKPLAIVQMLEFELGSKCNLGHVHHKCPNLHPERYGRLDTTRELDDDTIVGCAVRAYQDLGFNGLIGWIYYNEPLLQADRMFGLMARIKDQVPQARFILWTNGMLIPEECEQYRQFEQIVISGYNEQSKRGVDRLAAKRINARYCEDAQLDDRLVQLEPADRQQPCLRPFVEFILDNHGNHHLCCYDWQGQGSLGNVFTTDFAELARVWREQLPAIVGKKMTDQAPKVCQHCSHRWDKYQQHDERIVERARRYRATLEKQAEVVT